MEAQSLQQALQKYLENKATPEEVRWLLAHFHTDSEDQLMQLIMRGFIIDEHDSESVNPDQQVLDRVYGRMQHHLGFAANGYRRKPVRKVWYFAAAASVVLALSFGSYLLLYKQQLPQHVYYKNDIPPGHNQATLTLANGKKIILVKGLSGILAQQGNTQIGVNGQSAIAYNAAVTNSSHAVTYNTLATAAGEQSPYPLILSDGTKVWLDAKSSITFPVAFSGKERLVKITGEVYFEVNHDDAHPFKVAVKDQIVEDIGTHFNINAYDDESAIRTTLIEGAVKISVPTSSSVFMKDGVKLNPGEQAVVHGLTMNVANANIEKVLAWKNGYFRFNHEKIQSIMRELSRWYNIEVEYSSASSDEEFYATISRNRNISEVLSMLENTKGVHFKIEGRKVTVMQ